MNKPVPLVLQIQADAMDRSIPIGDLLRRARVASSKLGIKSSSIWIDRETNGYHGISLEEIPKYRFVLGRARYHNPMNGWQSIFTRDSKTLDLVTTSFFIESAPVLEKFSENKKSGLLHINHSSYVNKIVCESLGFNVSSGVDVSIPSVFGVVDRVRTLILDWAIDLEKENIIGRDLVFNINEKERAISVTNNYIANNIGFIGNVEGGSTVQTNQFAGSDLDLEGVRSLLQQLQQAAPMLPPKVRSKVEAEAAELQAEIAKPQPNQGRVRQLLGSIRATCEGAGGGIITAGVVEVAKALLGG